MMRMPDEEGEGNTVSGRLQESGGDFSWGEGMELWRLPGMIVGKDTCFASAVFQLSL